ncbi:MAG: hypothetical protein K2X27_28315 [Candidatus Obscuribacterales bacterium]|nr:hypothetical protein [Candidatus Obscuribacterales bacterium]
MRQRRIKNWLLITLLYLLLLPVAALAENGNEYEGAYHHLLEQRQRLLDDRAATIRNLNQCDSWLVQVDKALAYSPALNRQKLMASRSSLLSYRDKLRSDYAFQESSLHNLEKDLAWIEGEMKHLACMH